MAQYLLGKLGEELASVEFEGEEVSLDTVLEGVDTDGFAVTVNGEEPDEGQTVKDGDKVILVPEVSGG